ncbi:hypothetical protein ACROYT_G013593 [Oculina patagonica]
MQTLLTDGRDFYFTDQFQGDAWWISIIYINLFLYILSVIGNGILLVVFSKNPEMRTTTNMLVVSHLLAELLASSIGIAAHISTLMADERPFVTSTWCVAGTSAVKMCMGGGLLSLVGITVDRYLAVVKKAFPRSQRSRATGDEEGINSPSWMQDLLVASPFLPFPPPPSPPAFLIT